MRQILRNTPLETGNRVAFYVLATCGGFIGGWIIHAEWWNSLCLPIV